MGKGNGKGNGEDNGKGNGKGNGEDNGKGNGKGPEGKLSITVLFFLTLALGGGGCSAPYPSSYAPGKETQYPLYRRLVGPQGWSVWVQKVSPPSGFIVPDCPAHSELLY